MNLGVLGAAATGGSPGVAIGIVAILAGVVGAALTPLLGFLRARHKQSGTVQTSQAEDLWLNLNGLLTQYKEDLRETRAELVTTRAELVSTREALMAVQPMLARLAQLEHKP